MNYKEGSASSDNKVQAARASIVAEISSLAGQLSTAESDEAYYEKKRYEAADEEDVPWWNR